MSKTLTYHYCSLDTACAIISNQSLRLSDITKSNDSAEIEYGYAAAVKGLFRKGLIQRSDHTLSFTNNWIEALRPEYQHMLYNALTQHRVPPNRICYAICFSEQPDLLSQWRAYGDDGKGLALGFDLSDFRNNESIFAIDNTAQHPLENHMMAVYQPMVYGHEKSAEIFDTIAAHIHAHVQQLRSTASTDRCAQARAALLHESLSLITMTAFCKKRFFREEREWRLAIWGPNANEKDLLIRQRNLTEALLTQFDSLITRVNFQVLAKANRLVPTLDLGINLSSMLRSIVIGPRCEVTEQDLHMLLANASLDEVRIIHSKGTYR